MSAEGGGGAQGLDHVTQRTARAAQPEGEGAKGRSAFEQVEGGWNVVGPRALGQQVNPVIVTSR